MNFESDGIYHIYNQGNNRQKIFFTRENYLFFTRKIKCYVQPYGNMLAWCLMPNHFHLMMEVTAVSIRVTDCRNDINSNDQTITDTQKSRTLNDSIGIMLRSYTRAVNKQENRSGALFREETKAICLNEIKGISSDWFTTFGATFSFVQIPESRYPQACLNYIHDNPVKARLVGKPEDWEFSSYRALKELRDDSLVNSARVRELGLVV